MRAFILSTGRVFFGTTLLTAIGFIYHVVVVRLLGPEKYGVWGIAYAIVEAAVPVSALGIGVGCTYFLSKALAAGDAAAVRGISRAALGIVLSASTALVLGILGFAAFALDRVYPIPGLQPVLRVLAWYVPCLVLLQIGEAVFKAREDAPATYRPRLAADVLKLLVIPACLFLTGGNLIAMAGLTILTGLVGGGYTLRLMHRTVSPLPGVFGAESSEGYAGRLVRYSWPFLVTNYIQAVGYRADIFLIGYFFAEKAVGLYRPAVALAATAWLVPQALTYLLFPRMTKLLAEDPREYEVFSKRVFTYMIYANIPAVSFLVLFSNALIRLLYGGAFAEAGLPLKWLALATGTQTLYVVSGWVLAAHERTRWYIVINLAGMAVNLAANLLLLPRYGITGAAFASFLSFGVMMVTTLATEAMLTGRVLFPRRVLPVLLAAGLVILASFVLAGTRWDTWLTSSVLYGALLGALIVGGLTWEKNELRAGYALVRARLQT